MPTRSTYSRIEDLRYSTFTTSWLNLDLAVAIQSNSHQWQCNNPQDYLRGWPTSMARSPRPIFALFISFISCPIFSPIVKHTIKMHQLKSTPGLWLQSLLQVLLVLGCVASWQEETTRGKEPTGKQLVVSHSSCSKERTVLLLLCNTCVYPIPPIPNTECHYSLCLSYSYWWFISHQWWATSAAIKLICFQCLLEIVHLHLLENSSVGSKRRYI